MVQPKERSCAYKKNKVIQFQHREKGNKWGHLGRRLVHISSSLLVIYFLFPKVVFEIGSFKMYKALLLFLLFVLIPLPIEIWRLRNQRVFTMIRDTERNRVAAYMWTLMGAMGLCFLTEIGLPEFIAAPIIICAALGDPFLGEIRIITGLRRRHYYSLSVLMCFAIYFIWLGNPFLAFLAGFFTVIGESLNLELTWSLRDEMLYDLEHRNFILRTTYRVINKFKISGCVFRADDNLVMQLVPLVILLLLFLIFPGIYPPNSFILDSWPSDLISSYGFDTLFRV